MHRLLQHAHRPDGKFRRVRVTLANGREAELAYRQGYFADKTFAKLIGVERERQLEEALMLENPVTDITIAMEVNYFQLNRAEYFVPVAVKIPGSELALARRRGAQRTLLDFIGEVKDDYGITIQNVRDKLDIKLSDQTAAELASRPIQYETGFTLLPGQVRDQVPGARRRGRPHRHLPDVVHDAEPEPRGADAADQHGGARQPARAARRRSCTRSRTRLGEAMAAHPLVYDGQKLMPSVTRVFSASRELYVYLQAYERAATTTQPLVAFVTFYRGRREGVRDAADGGHRRPGRAIEGRAACA